MSIGDSLHRRKVAERKKLLINLLRTELGEEVRTTFETVVRLILRFYNASASNTDISSLLLDLYHIARDSLTKEESSWIWRVCCKQSTQQINSP